MKQDLEFKNLLEGHNFPELKSFGKSIQKVKGNGKNLLPWNFSEEYWEVSNYANRTLIKFINYDTVKIVSRVDDNIDTAFKFNTKNYFSLPPNTDVYLSFYFDKNRDQWTWFKSTAPQQIQLIGEDNSRCYLLSETVIRTATPSRIVLKLKTNNNTQYKLNIGEDTANLCGIGQYLLLKDPMITLSKEDAETYEEYSQEYLYIYSLNPTLIYAGGDSLYYGYNRCSINNYFATQAYWASKMDSSTMNTVLGNLRTDTYKLSYDITLVGKNTLFHYSSPKLSGIGLWKKASEDDTTIWISHEERTSTFTNLNNLGDTVHRESIFTGHPYEANMTYGWSIYGCGTNTSNYTDYARVEFTNISITVANKNRPYEPYTAGLKRCFLNGSMVEETIVDPTETKKLQGIRTFQEYANYKDEEDNYWCSDIIDWANGKYERHCEVIELRNFTSWQLSKDYGNGYLRITNVIESEFNKDSLIPQCLCTHFECLPQTTMNKEFCYLYKDWVYIVVQATSLANAINKLQNTQDPIMLIRASTEGIITEFEPIRQTSRKMYLQCDAGLQGRYLRCDKINLNDE